MCSVRRFPRPILLFGTECVFTQAVLDRLLAAGASLAGLVIARPGATTGLLTPPPAPDELPLVDPFLQPSVMQHAWRAGLPVLAVGRSDSPEAAVWLADQAPAAVIVACFPWRIPTGLRALAPLGFLNVHPSLLPAYRGPAPLFWQLRAGETQTGVTVHWMDASLDTGDLARQAPVTWPDGATGPELDQLLGGVGGELVIETLTALAAGTQPRLPQPPGGSVQSWPTPADFRLDPGWSARRAYNFLRGTEEWGRPYLLEDAGAPHAWRLYRALNWTADGLLPAPVVQEGKVLHIQFMPGVLVALGERVEP